MQNNTLPKLTRFLPWIIYGFIFLIFLEPIINLRLFLDDHVLVWPALTQTYVQDFLSYTYNFGLYRPIRLVFIYYPLYTLYSVFPWAPYLLLFTIHFVTGILVFLIFKKYIEDRLSLLLSVLYIVFPFFVEQYAWIATGIPIVNLILFAQLYISLVSKISIKKKLILIFALQLIGAFTYDTLFFNFILLGSILYINRREWGLGMKKISLYSFIFAFPSILYTILRGFIFYAHDSTTVRELRLTDLPNIIFIEINNLKIFFNAQKFLFLGEGSWTSFWQQNTIEGIRALLSNPAYLTLMNYFIISIFFYLFTKSKLSKLENRNLPLFTLLFIALLSLLPSFLVTIPSFPFRVIALSLWALSAAILIYINKLSSKLSFILTLTMIFLSLLFSRKILAGMRLQFDDDERMTDQIVKSVDEYTNKQDKVVVVLKDIPFSTNTKFNYGEYLASCVHTDWCVQMELARKTNKIKRVIINSTLLDHSNDLTFIFRYKSDQKSLILETPNIQ